MSKFYKYTLYSFIDTRFGDPVSSIALSHNSFIMGTMMGKTIFYFIPLKKSFTIIKDDSTMENISDISFINESVFLVGMGDEAIMKFTYNLNEPSMKPESEKINNYSAESEHRKACDNSYVMLSRNYMLKIMLHRPYDANITIETINADYIIKDFTMEMNTPSKKHKCEQQSIEMTNYAVPLDFNSPYFVWVEYHDDVKRFFCVANVINNDKENQYRYEINKQFGHISHCKLLQNGYVFIVRKLNVCEIRKLDEQFTITESFLHIGDEVYAIDITYNSRKQSVHTESNEDVHLCKEGKQQHGDGVIIGNVLLLNKNDEHLGRIDNDGNNDILYQHTNMPSEKINFDNEYEMYSKVQSKSNNNIGNKEMHNLPTNAYNTRNLNCECNNENGNVQMGDVSNKKKVNTVADTFMEGSDENIEKGYCEDAIITLLDVDGNVNVYEKGEIRKEFNLYDVEKIEKEHKEKQFFAMGYSYYMKYNGDYFAISSDHGCYIIKRSKV